MVVSLNVLVKMFRQQKMICNKKQRKMTDCYLVIFQHTCTITVTSAAGGMDTSRRATTLSSATDTT